MSAENPEPENTPQESTFESRSGLNILAEGQRTALCEMEERLLPSHVTYLNDPEVNRYLRTRPPVTLEHQKAWLQRSAHDVTAKVFSVFAKENGDKFKFIGVVSFRDIDPATGGANGGAVIGDKAYWKKGIASEARILQLHYGFSKLGINWVLGHSIDPNVASQKLLEHVGYTLIEKHNAARVVDGVAYDEYVYKISKEEFYAKWKDQLPPLP
ncbi:MAG: GCN5-like N-acetyltransferase [Parcubacteria group bacterium Gr01-1014_8]|nr:MAG: GCN5-like N-acetyltransferase [Parcubacteria group bacterium Gr01-1014_8]